MAFSSFANALCCRFSKNKQRSPSFSANGSEQLRTIKVGTAESSSFIDNRIYTTKYTVFTFLPKFFYEQFSKYANCFFLAMSCIQQIKDITPTNRYATIAPLSCVLFVTAIRELYEDRKRKVADELQNESHTVLLKNGTMQRWKWGQVSVGDIVCIRSGETFPADMVLVYSSEPDSLCYVETANLDGETNLKIKQANPETTYLSNIDILTAFNGTIKCEPPNNHIYTFEGVLCVDDKDIPLGPDQLLLRGSVLRNTAFVYGIVVFTGTDTKIMKNSSSTPIKQTRMEKFINQQIIYLFLLLLALALISTVAHVTGMVYMFNKHSYLFSVQVFDFSTVVYRFLTFTILFNNLVPISLIITMDIIRMWLASLINSDMEMYDTVTDTPAVTRTTTIVEELGQIEYILSDKTGTLTCNQMELKHFIIDGVTLKDCVTHPEVFHAEVKSADSVKVDIFMSMLAVCHTVIPEAVGDDIIYQASSPDEAAIVNAAKILSYKFHARKPRIVQVKRNSEMLSYELLALIEFNSTRKRMTVIVRGSNGKVMLFCKGADTVIMERLAKTEDPSVQPTLEGLQLFATEGLRTLCFAYREIEAHELSDWLNVWNAAQASVNNRQDAIDSAAALIEKDFVLCGATAVEDRLQDGVPETISLLFQAGIKLWVLTGDRQETAINIGYSCNLLDSGTYQFIVNRSSAEETLLCLEEYLQKVASVKENAKKLAMIIDGASLQFVIEENLQEAFLGLAEHCDTLICCRVSPLQKAQVTQMVKEKLGKICLGIGDGANDVGMIQSAHIGVGISGKEGLQAARSADFSIAQFRFLARLLLVHGSWANHRLAKAVLYSFYKNTSLYIIQFWFSFCNMFSGQTLFESWMLSLYNVAFTSIPVVLIGITDQYVNAAQLFKYPRLYKLGPQKAFFNIKAFWQSSGNGILQSLAIFVLIAFLFRNDVMDSHGYSTGIWTIGSIAYISALLGVTMKAALVANFWTFVFLASLVVSIGFWFIYFASQDLFYILTGKFTVLYGMAKMALSSPTFWAIVIWLPTLVISRDVIWKYYERQYKPRDHHIAQALQAAKKAASKKTVETRTFSTTSDHGYSFSQTAGQARIIDAYDNNTKTARSPV